MELLERLEDKYRAKHDSIDIGLPIEERIAWFNHPCTQRLVASLTADVIGMLLQWQAGAHMHPETEKTALENCKLLAKCQTASEILEKIEEIRSEETQSDSTRVSDSG